VHSVSLVHKLRETRPFVGFSRIIPDTSPEGGDKLRDLKLNNQINWLPAVTVRGEGIFLAFDRDRLRHWAGRARNRVERLARHYNEAATALGREQRVQYYKILTLQPVYPVKNANTSDRRFREIPAHVILGDAREGCKHGD